MSRFGQSQFQASYTLSRTRANLSLESSDGGLSAAVAPLDVTNPDLDWGRPLTDRTHIFNASLVLMLPTLQDKSPAVRAILGDWEIATIFAAGSGQPLNVFIGSVPGLPGGGASGTGYTDNQRPNRTTASCSPSGGVPEQIVNPAAFTIEGFQLGANGNARRGDCVGPNYIQTDMSFYKNIMAHPRVKVQLRFEVFNLFNRVNFLAQNLVTNMGVSNVTFNNADVANATAITGYTVAPNFGQAVLTRDPRQAQFGLRIVF